MEGRCREEDTDGNVCGSRPAPAAFSDSDSDEDLFGARVEKPTVCELSFQVRINDKAKLTPF